MNTRQHWMAPAVVAMGFTLIACTNDKNDATEKQSPAVVTEIEGSDIKQVTLTEKAVERVGLEMGTVADSSGSKTVPYASVLYDKDGAAWVFTSPQPLTFVRTAVSVSEITDDVAFLADGPAVGTEVVTIGTAELFGAELGIGF